MIPFLLFCFIFAVQAWIFIGIWSNCLELRGKGIIIMSLFWLQMKHKKIISIHCARHWDLEMSKTKESVHSPIIQWSVGERGKKNSQVKKKSAGDLGRKKVKINTLLLFNHFIQMPANSCSFLFSQLLFKHDLLIWVEVDKTLSFYDLVIAVLCYVT